MLPVDALVPEILASLGRHGCLVIEAQPGAGKTTRVPAALLGAMAGEIVVLEPRRIAARLAARRVAWELGEEVGGTVGYQVRFEDVSGPKTRLKFVTEGILTRRLLGDPELRGVDAVVLDEFHERHLESDLALALLKRLQEKRPGLKVVVMSATLDAGPVAAFLDGCPVLRSEGRAFPLTVRHLGYSPAALEVQVRVAAEMLAKEGHAGHTLVFLPGAAEIRRAMRECEGVARREGWVVLPLHGDLTPAEQDKAVGPSERPKLILATNVAESSVTIEGVTAVIDSGLARVATYSPWTGLPTLTVGRVSQASAKQRAGRAGRTAPGQVLRLYPEGDLLLRPEHDAPEIARADLAQLCLGLRAMGIAHVSELEWLGAPPGAAVEAAEGLLDRLGAKGELAERMSRLPLPPRLARVLLAAVERGVGDAGCLVAGLLSSGARREETDLLAAMEGTQDARTVQLVGQLRRIVRPVKQAVHEDDAVLLAVLSGFPDRVARRRAGKQVLLANGPSAELMGEAPAYEYMMAVAIEDRAEKPLPLIRMTARVEPEWLLDLFPERVRERTTLSWNRTAERVEAVSALVYDELVLEETRDAAPGAQEAAAMLAERALDAGIGRFVEEGELENLRARVAFAGLPELDVAGALRAMCLGLRSFAELRVAAKDLVGALERGEGMGRLRESAPATVRLSGGRTTKVHYEVGKPPWIASRLQDFFGMVETPRVGPERTPVVVHLLAPNHRAVQMTTDLAGFWERLYPQVRKELMRRYPRHLWPEKP